MATSMFQALRLTGKILVLAQEWELMIVVHSMIARRISTGMLRPETQ